MIFRDLTPYSFLPSCVCKNKHNNIVALNIGWIDKSVQYASGFVDSKYLAALACLYRNRVNQTRGFHYCPFCDDCIIEKIEEQEYYLGSAEIWVESKSGVVYAAPDLIYHYIKCHNYRPPDQFLDALLDQEDFLKA